MILSDISLREIKPVKPFCERTVEHGMTYGCGPAGYDIRIAEDTILLPGEASLASTIEEFNMPNNVMAFVHDKSTWARQFLAVQNTVIEPGWKGFLTLELSNHGKKSILIKAGSPIAQIVFHWIDTVPTKVYDGKYQNQRAGAVEAILEK